ncbi:class I SAM-dependent methyltransferase [Geotalea uraniireducens]|nr:class I SAM-dependent methyltransferase [Geotalea uraniireducens]
MSTPLENKSTSKDIQKRFDNDVDRFSNLETGQAATIDAPLAMELITQAAVSGTVNIRRVLDIGCGAGNNTLKLLQSASPFDCDLIDLSQPMLERAPRRIEWVAWAGLM